MHLIKLQFPLWPAIYLSIGRCLNVSHVSVYNWINTFGERLEDFRNIGAIEVAELDEMHTYIGSKKTTARYGLLLIEMGIGLPTTKWAQEELKRGENSGVKLKPLPKG